MQTVSLSVVVPIFRSAAIVPTLGARLGAVLDEISVQAEIILVDDGSNDRSWEAIQELAAADPRVAGIRLMRNYGQHNALLAGIRAANGELIVTIDDDLQQPPEEIPRLLEALTDDIDVVYGFQDNPPRSTLRGVATWISKLALRAPMGTETAGKVSPFRVFRTKLRDAFTEYRGPHVSIDVLLSWATTSFAHIPVEFQERTEGRSNYTFRKLAMHGFNMLTGFSTWPLRLASFTGFFSTVVGLGMLVYVVGRTLIEGGAPQGFPFLASIIIIFGGTQLFTLGIIGEYIARVHLCTMHSPLYAVTETSNLADGG